MAFVDKIVKSSEHKTCLIVAPSGGRMAWYFISVPLAKLKIFRKKVFSGPTNLENYGSILRSGYGQEPPQEVIQEMIEKYNFTPSSKNQDS